MKISCEIIGKVDSGDVSQIVVSIQELYVLFQMKQSMYQDHQDDDQLFQLEFLYQLPHLTWLMLTSLLLNIFVKVMNLTVSHL